MTRSLPQLSADLHDELSQLAAELGKQDPDAPAQLAGLQSVIAKITGWLVASGAHEVPASREAPDSPPDNVHELAGEVQADLAALTLDLNHKAGVPAEQLSELVQAHQAMGALVDYLGSQPAPADGPSGLAEDSASLHGAVSSMVASKPKADQVGAAFDAIDAEAARQKAVHTAAMSATNAARAGGQPPKYSGSRSKPYSPKPVYHGGGKAELNKIRGGN
jgi:hypothetical protein